MFLLFLLEFSPIKDHLFFEGSKKSGSMNSSQEFSSKKDSFVFILFMNENW